MQSIKRKEAPYNKAFFRLYEIVFSSLSDMFGQSKALEIISKIFEKSLKEAYDSMTFQKGNIEDFVRVVEERDIGVGLKVEFPEISKSRIIYRFLTDPFPNLKGKVPFDKFSDTYISFKVNYLLGSEWKCKTTKHFWKGDPYTDHEIFLENE